MGKKHSYSGKSMSICFPDFPHTMGFVAFSCTVGNLWENPCISHMLKYSIGWESTGKKAPILWENYGYRFPRFSRYHGFSFIFLYCGKLWGNPCISHMLKYTIRWEPNGKKASILWEKYGYQFSRLSPYHGFRCNFPYCGNVIAKPMHFPYAEVFHRMGIRWKKSTHTMGKV